MVCPGQNPWFLNEPTFAARVRLKVKPEARTQIGTPYYLSPEVPMSMGSKMAMGTLSSTIVWEHPLTLLSIYYLILTSINIH